MIKKSAGKEPTVELCAHSIECRMVGDKLTLEPVNFQIGLESEPEEPLLVIYMDARIKRPQVLSMLKAIAARIQSDDLPDAKMVLPGQIIGQLNGIIERILGLPDRERDGVVTYIDERLGAILEDEA